MTVERVRAAAEPAISIDERIALERVADTRFRGAAQPGPAARSYGGVVAGRAVAAAYRTVPGDRDIHSASMYFVRPSSTSSPVDLFVHGIRDGRSFSVREVVAEQGGRQVFTMTASFQIPEPGIEHQVSTLDVPPPAALPTVEELFADDPDNLSWIAELTAGIGLDARFPELPTRAAATRGERVAPRNTVWLRARTPVGASRANRAAALTYASDLLLLSAALGPHCLTLQGGRLQYGTLSHSIWFHAPISVDEWFLHRQESRWAGAGRALCSGEIFDAQGTLCATTMQEGLIRRVQN